MMSEVLFNKPSVLNTCLLPCLKNFLTELASGRGHLDDITKLSEGLVQKRHSKMKEILYRQAQVSHR